VDVFLKRRTATWFGGGRAFVRGTIARANAARDAGNFKDAALLYEEALRLRPDDAGILIQCGNMHKDSGDYKAAEAHYERAAALRPNNADIALQLGHLYKSWGRLPLAAEAYARAQSLRPDWEDARAELERVGKAGLDTLDAARAPTLFEPLAESEFTALATHLQLAAEIETLAPELAPGRLQDLLHDHGEEIAVRALGRRERSHWGILPTMRGIEAIRGFCISAVPVAEMQLYLNDQLVFRSFPKGGFPLHHERSNSALRKYVFNFWFDFSAIAHGRHDLEVRTIGRGGRSQNAHHKIVVADPMAEEDFPTSDQLVSADPADPRPIDDQINTRPSNIRSAHRRLLPQDPRTILVQRVDQLGDFVVSVPAIRRLREIYPAARIIGLLSSANAELGASLKLFDEIVVADFPEDRQFRRRVMPLEQQAALREKLRAFDIDIAIDLAENSPSRLLLTLSNARFKYGFRHPLLPNMPLDLEGNSHDPRTGDEMVPHSNKLVGLMEWLRAMARSEPNVEKREDLSRDLLARFDLESEGRFALLHDGARLNFSRWPYYGALAQKILAETDLAVVLLTDDKDIRSKLPEELLRSERFHISDGRLKFDEFDALVSFCEVFVGNDSGPKHLASLRGAKVISIHMARNSWNEWGQESSGYILSRKVPCAGCQIHNDPEECGRDFVCIRNIKPEEVMEAVRRLL